jgi:hypothetical protein
LESVWLNVSYEREKHIEKFINKLYLFFFNIKNFHLHTYENKKYLFIFIFLLEILLILWILRFVISLIIPSANIVIKPSETSETIIYNVRYYPNNDPHAEVETRFLYVPFIHDILIISMIYLFPQQIVSILWIRHMGR